MIFGAVSSPRAGQRTAVLGKIKKVVFSFFRYPSISHCYLCMRLVGGESGIVCFFCSKISKNAEMLQDAAECAYMRGGNNIQ